MLSPVKWRLCLSETLVSTYDSIIHGFKTRKNCIFSAMRSLRSQTDRYIRNEISLVLNT